MSTSTTSTFRVGQRVRLNIDWSPATAGTLCDIESLSPTAAHVVAYLPPTPEDPTKARPVSLIVPLGYLDSVRGRPFVMGDDDRRKDRVKGASRTATATATATPNIADAITAAVLSAIQAATPTPTASAIDEDAVRAIAGDVMAPVQDRMDALADAMGTLSTALADASAPVRARVRASITGSTSTASPIADALAKAYRIGEDVGVNALLCSPPSLGKSYGVRQFSARQGYDLFLEHACSGDMDEIATLLGSAVPRPAGGFAIVDGVLTQAVRAAGSGQHVMLLLDEVLRLSHMAQEWLLTFLTGVKQPDGTRTYRLRTRRPDGDDVLEVIECPAANLHVVGATNLGMITPVEAFWSRWAKVRFAFSTDVATDVCRAVLQGEGITGDVDTLASLWASVIDATRRSVAAGDLRYPADVRVLEHAARLSDGTAKDTARIVARDVVDHCAHWSADLGDTDPKSADTVNALVAVVANFAL